MRPAKIAGVLGLAASAALAAATCAHAPPAPPPGMGRLRIDCRIFTGLRYEPDRDADIVIDGTWSGSCGDWQGNGRYIRTGQHHVTVRATEPRMFGHDEDIDVPEGGQVAVRASYGPLPD